MVVPSRGKANTIVTYIANILTTLRYLLMFYCVATDSLNRDK